MGLKNAIKDHLRSNLWQYLILLVVFVLGLVEGNIKACGLSGGTRGHLLDLLNEFINSSATYEPGGRLLIPSILAQVKLVVVMWFLGLTVIGTPLVLGLVFARGFSLGFTIGFLVNAKGQTGALVALVSVAPQNIIYVPLLILTSLMSINFSLFIIKRRSQIHTSLWKGFAAYTMAMLCYMILFAGGALIETYVPPWLLAAILK
ncbi:MAG: stage II sporulation protein M [Candidatus Saccharibacteria bacterium]